MSYVSHAAIRTKQARSSHRQFLALVRHLERIYNHRLYVLEGIRVAAHRNMDHLTRTMRSFGIERFTSDASLIAVQNRMLQDQGLQPNPTQRWLLGSSASNAWEVYLCLLYAEIESYRSNRGPFRFPTLDAFIRDNSEAIRAMKSLRDKLLHPKKDVIYEKTLSDLAYETAHGPQVFARSVQLSLDQYLRALKDHLIESYSGEVARLPDNLLRAFVEREASHLTNALIRADDTGDKQAIRRLIDDHGQFSNSLKLHPARRNDPLNMRDRKHLRRLDWAKAVLISARLPDGDFAPESAIQTPVHARLSSFIPVPPQSNVPFFFGPRLPQFIGPAREDYLTLTFRSMLLFNESYQHGESLLLKSFPGKTLAEIRKVDDWKACIPRPETWEGMMAAAIDTSPGMVALALLTDPLKAYRRATKCATELVIPEIERFATPDRTRTLYAWRNSIFHVPDSRIDKPERLELEFGQTCPIDYYPSVIRGLLRFFLAGDSSPLGHAT